MASGREEYFQRTFNAPLPPGAGVDRDAPGEGRAVYDQALEPVEGRETVWRAPQGAPPPKPRPKPVEVSSGSYQDWTQLRFKLWPEELGPEPENLVPPDPPKDRPPKHKYPANRFAPKPKPDPVRIVPRSPRPRG